MVVFNSQGIDLDSGTILVSSRQGFITRIDKATITVRAGETGKFLARRVDGELQVLTLEGTVYVSNGQEQTPVPATKGVKLPKDTGQSGGAGTKPSWITNPDIGILVVVAAAIAAGVTVGIINSQNSKAASPATP